MSNIKVAIFFSPQFFRQNPPGSVSGRHLGDAAHRLVSNSLQMGTDRYGYQTPTDVHAQHPPGYGYNPPQYVPPIPYQHGGYIAPHGAQGYAQPPPYQSRGGYQPRGPSGRFPSEPYQSQSRGGHHDSRGGGYSGNQHQQQQQWHGQGGSEHNNPRGYGGQHNHQQGGDRDRRGAGGGRRGRGSHHHDQGGNSFTAMRPRHRY